MEFLIRYLKASTIKETVMNADKTNPRMNVYKKKGTALIRGITSETLGLNMKAATEEVIDVITPIG